MPSKKSSTTTTSANAQENDELSSKYQQKTDKQHILDNPDTYVGSIEQIDSDFLLTKRSVKTSSRNCKTPNLHC